MNVIKGTISNLLSNASFHPERYALWMGIVYDNKKYNGHLDYNFNSKIKTLVLYPEGETIYALKKVSGQITLIER